MRSFTLSAAVALSLTATAAQASPTSEETFAESVTALEKGAFDRAIDHLESLADRGFVHPDASFNRGVSYAGRAGTPQAKNGDLGQAVAALSETLLLRPGDNDAERALGQVRNEIARKRSSAGGEPVVVRPSLDRALVGLASEEVWAVGAAIGSLLLTAGLVVRGLFDKSAARIGAGLATVFGLVLLLTFGALAAASAHLRRTTSPAVVVVTEARILERSGEPVVQRDGKPEYTLIPEGAEVEAHEREGELTRLRWGSIEGYLRSNQLRLLSRAP